MTKSDLITKVAGKVEDQFPKMTKKEIEQVISATFDSITEALAADDKVQLVGFGTFEVRERAARSGRDPRTGESMEIAASKAPAFKAGQALKDAVNGRK